MIGTTAQIRQVEAQPSSRLASSPLASSQIRSSRLRAARAFTAFTLMEVLIVVVVIGLLATLVIPKFSAANQQTRQNSLKDDLQYLRTQITVFKAQHQEVPPGYPNGDPTSDPTMQAFAAQMTQHTNITCQVNPNYSANYQYGPYLKQLPPNPVNNLSTLAMIGNNQPMPQPDGRTGWIYKAQTQEIMANIKGKDDSGIPYSSY